MEIVSDIHFDGLFLSDGAREPKTRPSAFSSFGIGVAPLKRFSDENLTFLCDTIIGDFQIGLASNAV